MANEPVHDPSKIRITASNRFAVADRIRAVLALSDPSNLPVTARWLNVSDAALRAAIDPRWPEQTLDLLASIVQRQGVDPTFLITGDYNPTTHRAALENDREFIERLLIRIAAGATDSPGFVVSLPTSRS